MGGARMSGAPGLASDLPLDAFVKRFDEARNNTDPASMAALFTEDAIIVTNKGPIYGPFVILSG
jgi:hypothetical protein